MAEQPKTPPRVNGILETSLYVESVARSAEFYRRVFGWNVRQRDRSVLLLFKKGATPDTDASGSIHVAFGIARSELSAWENWIVSQGVPIEFRESWKYGAEALFFRDPDGHLLEVVTPGVWAIY